MKFSDHNLIIVTPVYEDVESSSRLFKELSNEFKRDVFVVAVDDGSVRDPVEISSLESAGIDGVVLKLRRNVGHQRAIAIGLGYISEYLQPSHLVVIMDSDGEDLPDTISLLLKCLQDIQVEAVVAQRKSRVETIRFKVFYAVYKSFFSLMTGRNISFGNFMALKPQAVRRLVVMQELSIHVAAALLSSKLRTKIRSLDRGPRYAGQSKMNFVALVLHGFKALMVFAEDVLVRVGIACAIFAVLSVIGVVVAVLLKVLGFSTPGWFSVSLGILVLMLLQIGALALMSLMLTGVVRGGTITNVIFYHEFIESVFETSKRDI